jgi:uncharacterized membrane protein
LVISVAGVTRESDATITEQIPDERVAWRSDDGPDHAGVIECGGSQKTGSWRGAVSRPDS